CTLAELAEQEASAPELEIIRPVEIKKPSKPPVTPCSKLFCLDDFYKIYSVVISVAAVLLFTFILYVNINPAKPSVPTATIVEVSDTLNTNLPGNFVAGARLNTHSQIFTLASGRVRLAYDYGAQVVIEGPAEFQIGTENVINLNRGRLYTSVDYYCKGFTVKTPSSILIDIGTEFGVEVNVRGDSQLHVYKGQVVMSTTPDRSKQAATRYMQAGQAASVENGSDLINSIAFKDDFKRDVSDPVFFEGFELLPSGPILNNARWTTTQWHRKGPDVVATGLIGTNGLLGVKREALVGGAGRSLPRAFDLARMTTPLYVSAIIKWQERAGADKDKDLILTLSEINDDNVSTGILEGGFDLDNGVKLQYARNGVNETLQPSGNVGEPMAADTQYLCVMKITPHSPVRTTVSLGYYDISNNKFPEESEMLYQYSVDIDPSQMLAAKTNARYYLSHIAISVYSEMVLADNLMVTEKWSHMRMYADR
ncbi:MAG: FecR domain-containing protein, partial [Sedimentisphaerales bacterium]|nr:FecR domain-containing protein [Sedimentisphaerales bacterium]